MLDTRPFDDINVEVTFQFSIITPVLHITCRVDVIGDAMYTLRHFRFLEYLFLISIFWLVQTSGVR